MTSAGAILPYSSQTSANSEALVSLYMDTFSCIPKSLLGWQAGRSLRKFFFFQGLSKGRMGKHILADAALPGSHYVPFPELGSQD